ncbi:50S ribosomal protein L33 [Buchnera aphidicola]|uniref:Large ribosomal subunit protein bL33 n=1 Tax=Buchnera aphidicola subsp. Cinara cedri (strain Cc) TaxID=372461 RepID=RL33_BUCCC|nr:50S ribosomal protein L33 [Buchnera aphidicola]Q058B9.1 RecName: Full=Large ribosomal subunit protein bL33; AltName: Full=50S ribosomal protein L33 [Buchnera aphidicola BCc]ABJ90530.1 50S ribosomal protein L33 [Buchnera aphidicola BCc]
MAKTNRIKIKLISSSGSKHFYTTTKNKKNQINKLSLKKYDPIIKKHVIYQEKKI